MLKVSDLMQVSVFMPKRKREGDPTKLGSGDLSLVGQVRQVVFDPYGKTVVGLLVRRPDVAGMIKREDAFVALDSIGVGSAGLVLTNGEESIDNAARSRLALDWDACILWVGMDAKTSDGKELGWVSDVEFYPKSGKVKSFFVDDGNVAKSLVGSVVIPADLMIGYRDGYLVADPKAATLALNGGLAARAGEGYARAKLEGKEVASKAGKAAGDAVEKGAYGLGRAIGKAKKSVQKGAKEAQKSAEKKKASGKKGMFGAFLDEYKKASK